jgi:hypothetical protein
MNRGRRRQERFIPAVFRYGGTCFLSQLPQFAEDLFLFRGSLATPFLDAEARPGRSVMNPSMYRPTEMASVSRAPFASAAFRVADTFSTSMTGSQYAAGS